MSVWICSQQLQSAVMSRDVTWCHMTELTSVMQIITTWQTDYVLKEMYEVKQPAGVFRLTWPETSPSSRRAFDVQRVPDDLLIDRLSLWTSWTSLNTFEEHEDFFCPKNHIQQKHSVPETFVSVRSMQDGKVLFPGSVGDKHGSDHRAETGLSSDSQPVAFTIKLIQSLDWSWSLFPTDTVNVWICLYQRNYERKIQTKQRNMRWKRADAAVRPDGGSRWRHRVGRHSGVFCLLSSFSPKWDKINCHTTEM